MVVGVQVKQELNNVAFYLQIREGYHRCWVPFLTAAVVNAVH